MAKTFTTEDLINNWNVEFPNYKLKLEELNKPITVFGALFNLFDRIGIDRDAVLMPPTEKNLNEHIPYYWDMIPVINVTRVINHLVPNFTTISVDHFLQPTVQTSHSILLLLFNLMLFHEERLRSIAPQEEGLFGVAETAKALEEKKNKMFEMLNNQAEEKAKRAERVEQMLKEITLLEEELQVEEASRDQENQELDKLIKENNATDILLDQKRATKDGLLAERERKRALRVYDADDIKSQAVQAALNVQEAEEKLNSLQAVIAQKDNSLKILQMIKPSLDTANNLLHDITKLKDYELGNLDEDSKEGECDVLNTELMELRMQESDLRSRRADAGSKRQESHARRQQERTLAESAVREAEEKDKKRCESSTKAIQRTQEIKRLTSTYDEQKSRGYENIQQIRDGYNNALKEWEEAIMKLLLDLKNDIERKEEVENNVGI